MDDVLVSLPNGATVRRDKHGVLLSGRPDGGGVYLRTEDCFHPETAALDESRSVVAGLLYPGAVSVEAIDVRGRRVTGTIGSGAYVAELDQPIDRYTPIVVCRDAEGRPVRRPWAAEYPSVQVTDTTERCPACGSCDWDEYTPFEEWRGGRGSKVDGTNVPNPVVSCRVCGHEEGEGTFFSFGRQDPESEDETARAARLVRLRAQAARQRWLSKSLALRAVEFPIYGADRYPADLAGSGSHDDQLTSITVHLYDASPVSGERPRLAITTKQGEAHSLGPAREARLILESWIHRDEAIGSWPDASNAARTLWLRARDRRTRAETLDAARSDQPLTIDDQAVMALVLTGPRGLWVAVATHCDLTIIVCARDVEPADLQIRPVSDPLLRLLGPEPPDPPEL